VSDLPQWEKHLILIKKTQISAQDPDLDQVGWGLLKSDPDPSKKYGSSHYYFSASQ
jgi:hypothetical protein